MKVLIIGASSYLGARIYFDLQRDFELIGTFHNTLLETSGVNPKEASWFRCEYIGQVLT